MDFLKEIELITKKYLAEAGLDYSHNKLGETKFTKTDGSEDYIQAIIEATATSKNITKAEAQKIFDTHVAAAIKKMEKSPKINNTMMTNIAESVAFELLDEIPDMNIKFEKRVFQELFQEVKSEVPEFYPLSNMFEPKRIDPSIYYSPDKLYPEFNSIGTAACTPDAKLIFNVPFMEKLMKFAVLKGIKASPKHLHGKKYESQGGKIPDSYLYCEFVLLHEIMHYGNGDFYYEKAYNLNGNIVNYVGDFITNYNLVKSGYEQLPIGLFNDEINYDRYPSYQRMYDIVEEELNKLSKDEQQNMMDQLDKMGDAMPANGEGADPQRSPKQQQQPQDGQDGQPQDGQSQDGQSQDGQPQDGQDGQSQDGQSQDGQGSGDGQSQDGQSQDGQGSGDEKNSDDDKKNGSGAGKESDEEREEQKRKEAEAKADMQAQKERAKEQDQNEKDGKTSGTAPANGQPKGKVPDKIDETRKSNEQTLENAQQDVARETKTGMNKDAISPGAIASMMSGENNGTGKNSADGNPYALAERQYKPKMNWKQLLKKMVPSGLIQTETYAKPSRRTTSSMVSIAQTGSGVVKPGTKEESSDKRGLCFVLDNSGSTMDKIGEMQNDIMMLMAKEAKKINGTMYVLKFSNDVHYFKVDIKRKKYARITDVEDFIKTGSSNIKCDQPIKSLFRSSYGGGTELTAKITMAVKTLFAQKFNVILFSDSDIVAGHNGSQLKQIFKAGKKQLALIGCDKTDYKNYVDLLGDKGNITYYA